MALRGGRGLAGRALASSLTVACALLSASPARAWLFEEHANIGRLASVTLSAQEAAEFDALWDAARRSENGTTKLCVNGRTDPTHDRTWTCLDFGALPAASGDHSCSPEEMWSTVLTSSWFPGVYDATAETERLIHAPDASDSAREDAWHQGNLILQYRDPDYASRAAKNNVHFVLAREDGDDTLGAFIGRAASCGTPPNATIAYATYHLAALALAARLAKLQQAGPDHDELARRVLTTESFALHFLEDSFSAGHFVGLHPDSSGSLPDRSGTHDYYCEHGLDARMWGSPISYAAHGDAFESDACSVGVDGARTWVDDEVALCPGAAQRASMSSTVHSDMAMSAAAVRASLGQVLEVIAGATAPLDGVTAADERFADVNVCTELAVSCTQETDVRRAIKPLLDVLAMTPQPYRESPELPHFRSEYGGLFRASGATRLGGSFGNYDPTASASTPRFQSAMEVGLGIGGGLEGVTTHATDGTLFVEASLIAYGQEKYPSGHCTACTTAPTRFGFGVRVHLPFWLFPGDALLALPLAAYDENAAMEMLLKAAQGSVLDRVERVHPGTILTWQLVLGREAALYWSSASPFHMKEVEAPLLELRTPHAFAGRTGGDAAVQLGGTFEWETTDDGSASRRTYASSAYLRLAFDGLFYFYP